MSDKSNPDSDMHLFQEMVKGIKPLKQDKRTSTSKFDRDKKSQLYRRQELSQRQRSAASFEFSDHFEAYFNPDIPLKYFRDKATSAHVKRLRKGDYPPDITLDLHGYNKAEAKSALISLLDQAKRQHCHCVCIIHGKSGGVLRQQIPNWLVQHPEVLGFHEAPLLWGGKGALLVLISVME